MAGVRTLASAVRREFWRPEDHRVLVPKQPQFGLGWAVNVAEIVRRFRGRR